VAVKARELCVLLNVIFIPVSCSPYLMEIFGVGLRASHAHEDTNSSAWRIRPRYMKNAFSSHVTQNAYRSGRGYEAVCIMRRKDDMSVITKSGIDGV
jgi:hypothetical protein